MAVIDYHFLEKNFYYFRIEDHPNKIYSVTLSKFNERAVLKDFIDNYGSKIKALNTQVPATYFCTAYGWFLAAIQYGISYYDTVFQVTLENIELQMYYIQEYDSYGICFRIVDPTEKTINNDDRKTFLEQLYKNNAVPLVELFATTTGVRLKDLYGQLSIGLYHGYDLMVAQAQTDELKTIVHSDFNMLTKELDPASFNSRKNPLNISYRMIESPRDEGKMLRMKPTCCLYYQTEGAPSKCYGCPRLSDRDRAVRRKEIQASLT
ncbi:hypothetical protein DS745_06050 [Anaerobacillus alkaliphilus]|uniref:(2Fe-2S)-binding protein n=1 Tax=Anaerobacillus alkaliphilus TaxID=1548597 RepID=A0A4V1LGP1_9BACI|nr:(2Fe-2S)-binding protein [Anaerobacillus alkaliphilus]RXJ02532.1 hypothetical protein DS745_06050 [Anaerobacillus alkaliphilus]